MVAYVAHRIRYQLNQVDPVLIVPVRKVSDQSTIRGLGRNDARENISCCPARYQCPQTAGSSVGSVRTLVPSSYKHRALPIEFGVLLLAQIHFVYENNVCDNMCSCLVS